jgi:hypothetical protein
MAITQSLADSFKKSLLDGDMDFRSVGGDTFKLALYTSNATLNGATTAYTTTEEVPASGQYTAGGGTLINGGTSVASSTARFSRYIIYRSNYYIKRCINL